MVDSIKNVRRMMGIIIQAAPDNLTRMLVLKILVGAGPAVLLFVERTIINEVAANASTLATLGTFVENRPLLSSVLVFLCVNFILDSAETLDSFEVSALRDKVTGAIKANLYAKVALLPDITLFEDPKRLNTLHLALQGTGQLALLVNVGTNLMTGAFLFIPVVLLAFSLAPWIPFVIFLTSLPSTIVQLAYDKKTWSVQYAQVDTVRQMNTQEEMLSRTEYAKEIRLFGIQPFILAAWKSLFQHAYAEVEAVRQQGTQRIALWSILGGLGTGLPYLYVLFYAWRGVYSLGDLVLYAGLIYHMRRSLFVLMGNMGNVNQVLLDTAPIFQVLDFASSLQTVKLAAPVQGKTGIQVTDLSFTYPGQTRPVLRNITLTVAPGEMIAIVGENGAGKSTLTKLFCRFYDPAHGKIEWDGVDLRALDLDTLRGKIGAVFQDFAKFPASIRANIGFGLLANVQDDDAILRAAAGVGLADMITKLPTQIETPLSPKLTGGIDLSGGQWQRIAIARALFRQPVAELLLFDEPTSAIDPAMEYEIYETMRALAKGRMTIVISHRLALTRFADRIIVMHQGQIAEQGTHETLMQQADGLYRSMFLKQAYRYTDVETTV